MLLVDRQALSEHTTTSSSTQSLGQALRVSLVKPGAYLSESYGRRLHSALMLSEGGDDGSALHVILAKRFRVPVDQKCLPMVGRSTENYAHQRDVPKVWTAEV